MIRRGRFCEAHLKGRGRSDGRMTCANCGKMGKSSLSCIEPVRASSSAKLIAGVVREEESLFQKSRSRSDVVLLAAMLCRAASTA